ncbi:MAG TPA: hypothetical protein VOA87_08690 [Thermoanaerobaculia bacterium]|nr:hypothetical protein [Thermoanaerobaculia bacterium]
MTEDYLWKHTELLAHHLGGEVSSQDGYCPGTRTYEWENGQIQACDPGEYEQVLLEFLLHNPAGRAKAGLDVLVLIGGIGTGKSTTVQRMISHLMTQPRTCSRSVEGVDQCNHPPIIINLNTGNIFAEPGRLVPHRERVKSQLADFWNMAASRFEELIGASFSFENEAAFWAWALGHAGIRDRSTVLHRWLNEAEHQIRALATGTAYSSWSLADIAQSLERQRSALMNSIPGRDLVWYRVFQLIYGVSVLANFKCTCRYIILDNVDQLEPEVQRELVDFVILLSDILGARTLISIRPLTWERSVHAHMLVRTENHYAPSVLEVMQARILDLEKDRFCPVYAPEYLRSLITTLTTPGSLWGDMYDATSGLSVRFAIRNFLNFSQSKLLPPLSQHSAPLEPMKASEIARAFFFGDGESLLYANLENIYALGNDMRQEYRLVKPRILDFLIRTCSGATSIEDLANTVGRFGYTNQMILKAINDLLLRSRPLLWSQDGHQISSLGLRSRIAVTPIGRGYHSSLFGQLYYDEVCIARSAREVVPLEKVLDFHRRLWEQDRVEISHAVRKYGAGLYLALYPRESPAISAIHAAKLKEGVERRATPVPSGYDAERSAFIANEVEKLLGPRW